MIRFKLYCEKCKIVYQRGTIDLIKRKGCDICGDNKVEFAFGKWDEIR